MSKFVSRKCEYDRGIEYLKCFKGNTFRVPFYNSLIHFVSAHIFSQLILIEYHANPPGFSHSRGNQFQMRHTLPAIRHPVCLPCGDDIVMCQTGRQNTFAEMSTPVHYHRVPTFKCNSHLNRLWAFVHFQLLLAETSATGNVPTIVLQAGATPGQSTANSAIRWLSCWLQNICRMSSEVVSDGTPQNKFAWQFETHKFRRRWQRLSWSVGMAALFHFFNASCSGIFHGTWGVYGVPRQKLRILFIISQRAIVTYAIRGRN